eukprot:3140896-Rhodomonas_salina.6
MTPIQTSSLPSLAVQTAPRSSTSKRASTSLMTRNCRAWGKNMASQDKEVPESYRGTRKRSGSWVHASKMKPPSVCDAMKSSSIPARG